jgi:ABC-type dipeptide/oligopeptide/nickel transport system permease component
MLRYILRRMGYGLLILIGVNLLTFFLFFTVNTPDDMARLNIGGKRITQELSEGCRSSIENGKGGRLQCAELLPTKRSARHKFGNKIQVCL